MSIANYSAAVTIADGGLGIVGAGLDGTCALIGTASSGTNVELNSYGGSETNDIVTEYTSGPLCDQGVKHLLNSGGKTTTLIKSAGATAGASSAVTQSGTGPTVTVSGAPVDDYDSIVVIIAGGARGTATFQYSLDGGDTYSDTIATAATYLLPSGVTVNFAVGTYVADETYSWTDTAPINSTSNIGAALDALITSATDVEMVHVLGSAASAADAATMAATLSTKVASAWAAHKYFFIVFEGAEATVASHATAFASYADKGVVGCGGFCELVNARTGEVEKKSSARVIVPRLARNPISIMPWRDAADANLDPFSDVVSLVTSDNTESEGYHDEEASPGYTAARFNSLRTVTGTQGVYAAGGVTMAANTSDFQLLPYLRIVLKAARTWYQFAISQLGRRVPTKNGGTIDERFARAIERLGEARIEAALGSDIIESRVLVSRTDVITSTQTLNAQIRVRVGGYLLTFNSEIGLASELPAAA